jgi:hypothetical protein
MKRLLAMLLMIAFAWGGVVTASHAVTCNDSDAVTLSASKSDISQPTKAPSEAKVAHHCVSTCHGSAGYIPLLGAATPTPVAISEQVSLSDAGLAGRVLAVPTPPPSLV